MDARQLERQDGEGVLETDRSGGAEDGSIAVAGSEGATAGGLCALLVGAARGAVGTGHVGWAPGAARSGGAWPGVAPGGGTWPVARPGWPAPTPSAGAWMGSRPWPGTPPVGNTWPGSTPCAGAWPGAPAGAEPRWLRLAERLQSHLHVSRLVSQVAASHKSPDQPNPRSDLIRSMPPPQPSSPPALPDELIELVLLRVPPDDPATLVRAALACRRWCRLVADPDFRRRRLELHRATPPMLGVLFDGIWDGKRMSTRFFPTSTCRPPRGDHRGLRSFDARHGRVLLHGSDCYSDMVVWDPITDQRVELPSLPGFLGNGSMKATVLCAATGACDHLDCHRGPFIVVLVGTNDDIIFSDDDDSLDGGDDDDSLDGGDDDDSLGGGDDDTYDDGCRIVPKDMFSCIYSLESGAWSEPTYDDHPGHNVGWERSALVGNALFFALQSHETILKYDLGTQQMSVMRLPYVRTDMLFTDFVPIELTTLEDGRLGFARVEKSYELCLWSRGEGDDVEGWTLCKVIDLKDLFPLVDSICLKYCLVGFVESVCVAFVEVQGGLFTVDMKSGLMKRVSEGRGIRCAVPYINFCNPALEAPSSDDGQRVGISSGKGGCLKGLKS